MTKTYFAQIRLTDGRYVNIVYTSDHRKGTSGNQLDLLIKSNGKADIDTAHYLKRRSYRGRRYNELDLSSCIYLMNDKNKYEECFEDYETIDLQ